MVDALGNPTGFFLTGGEAHDLVGADHLLPDMQADTLIGDKGFDADERVIEKLAAASRLPSFSDGPESIGEDRLVGEHRGEAFDEWDQLLFGHVRHEVVEHGALAEQRMGAALGGV
jgi:hypothetical protein